MFDEVGTPGPHGAALARTPRRAPAAVGWLVSGMAHAAVFGALVTLVPAAPPPPAVLGDVEVLAPEEVAALTPAPVPEEIPATAAEMPPSEQAEALPPEPAVHTAPEPPPATAEATPEPERMAEPAEPAQPLPEPPVAEAPPQEPEPVVAALPPPPPPVPVRPPPPRPQPPRAARAPAPPPSAVSPETGGELFASAAPAPSASAAPRRPNAVPTWQGQLMGQLMRARRYPEGSRARREEGVTLLTFALDRAGRVVAASVARSSGHPALDAEALALVRRAEPLPPPPPEMEGPTVALTAPISFNLR